MATPLKANGLKGKSVLFIHHSTGGNLIREGNLREEIYKLDPTIQFWDHNYNLFPIFTKILATNTHLKGLTDNNANLTMRDYNIVLSNNSPKEYAEIFSRDSNDPTLKSILSYDLIAFKNCFPTTRIVSEQQLEEDIGYYKIIRDSVAKYPGKHFVLLTPPPERKETTNPENAKRAKRLVNWLQSNDFLANSANIHVFDLFGQLADGKGYLRQEYTRFFPRDSHPNKKANKAVAPLFATYLASIAKSF